MVAPAGGARRLVVEHCEGGTRVNLAKAVGLTQPYVSDVAHGRYRTITVENARKFASYLGWRIEDLFL